ncbi:PREDICTED: kunitz trypsin inhibitor 2-like [Nicotiana attenuata]|uniref:21 kDa seed protein n=1 Tax=Nicotiana attenuata TaxID=49451 RepID=A0A1J6J4C0_NICAT|nr:PREDICTED: kunitz trypsin inhibitor 2-like [Nicotiana attenuata]OIT04727.1 21 kda seed protein [Nicotiana attenuata]
MRVTVSRFIVPFLLVALSTSFFFLVKAQNVSEPVLDISGNAVRKGANYLIVPAGRGSSGGLDVSSIRNTTNPLVVSQNTQNSSGTYLQFSPVNPKENTIRVSTDLNIKYTSMIISDSSTVWRINTELIPQRHLVTVGGVEGNPGRETLSNWFRIDKYEDAYKLVYCPGVCETCRPFCGDIGILVEGSKRVLFVGSNQPLKVKFEYINSDDPWVTINPSSNPSIANKLSILPFVKVVMCIIVICHLIKVA